MNSAPAQPTLLPIWSRVSKRLLESAFLKNIATISLGQGFASFLPLAAAPILGRLYNPSDYGYLATYMAWAGVFAAIGNWQYAQGIIAVKQNKTAQALLKLCWCTSLLTALATLPLVVWLYYKSKVGADISGSGFWIFFLPLSTFIAGVSNALGALINRENLYKKLALIQLFPSPIAVGLSLWMGWRGWGVHGLFASYLASQLAGFILTLLITNNSGNPFRIQLPWVKVLATLRKYRNFPLFTLPSSFVFVATSNAVIYSAPPLKSLQILGSYGRANGLLAIPLGLLGGSISQVFQRKAAIEYHEQGNCLRLFWRTALLLFVAGGVPLAILGLFAPSLFTWFLGPKWHEAGKIAQILAPMLLLRMVSNPLASIFFIAEKQKLAFKLTLITHALVWALTLGGLLFSGSVLDSIKGFSLGFAITYIIFFYYSVKLAAGKQKNQA